MIPHRSSSLRRGFTLVELLVAMAITVLIASVLVGVTSVAVDAWSRSRAELRASRQAKFMVEAMVRDFESMVRRTGNTYQWLSAVSPANMPGSGTQQAANASNLVFFSAATDRYDGKLNGPTDKGGDISCVAYQLDFRNPVTGTDDRFSTFTLNRLLVNPDEAFQNLLGQTDLEAAFQNYRSRIGEVQNFVCENIYQYSITFHVEVEQNPGTPNATRISVPVAMGPSAGGGRVNSFKLNGTGIEFEGTPSSSAVSTDQLKAGRLSAVEISLTVITDAGLRQLQNSKIKGDALTRLLQRNTFQYSKRVQLPGM